MQEHKNHTCNPKAKKGESQLYDQDCVIDMLDEARSDERRKVLDENWEADSSIIAKRIFEELAKIGRQQLEPAQLERFAKEFFDAKDESEAFAIAQKFSKIVFNADEYKAVKNKWVD